MYRYFFPFLFILFPLSLSAQNFDTDAEKSQQLIEAGRFDEAKPITARLLRQAASLSDASALTDIGIALEDSGRYTEAEPFHERALEINERQHGKNHSNTVPTLTNLAINYKERGRYAKAEPLYEQALKIVKDTNSFHSALLMNNLAFLYQEQYRYDEAENLYKEALVIHEKRTRGKDDEYMASPLQNLARLYYFKSREAELREKQDLLGKAESYAKRALDIDEKYNPDDPQTGASLNMLGAVYSDQGRFVDAERLLKWALAIYKISLSMNHPWYAECSHDLATLYERQKNYVDALPLRNHTIDVFHQSGAEAHLGQDWYNSRAALYKVTGYPEEALKDLRDAMKQSFTVRDHACGNAEQRAHTFSRYYNLFERMVDWQHGLLADGNKLGDINEAYKAMEDSRAQALLNIMMAHHIDLLVGVPEETAQPLRAAKDVALAEIATARETNQMEALKIAEEKFNIAMEAIYSISPAYRQMKFASLDTVRGELIAEKSLALEYLIGDEKSYLLLYGFDTDVRLLPLLLDDKQAELFGVEPGHLITKKLATLLQTDENGVPQIFGAPTATGIPGEQTLEKLAALWAVLIPDEQIRIKITDRKTFAQLLILPDRTLARFPFETLIVKPDAEPPRYLLDDGPATIYVPSASMYYFLKKHKTEAGKPQTLTVGKSKYSDHRNVQSRNRHIQKLNNSRGATVTLIDDLVGTEEETEYIEESCKSNGIAVTRFIEAQSTEENVRQHVAGKTIVHLACHGQAIGEGDANFSALLLTIGDPNTESDDGFLELAEMFTLRLKACELAVLSACVTNLGLNQTGEGTWSLGRGMLAAGSKRVITTNWSVDDKASADLVFFFINEINESIAESSEPNHAAALRQAKREIRCDQKHPHWQHPCYWAPFVLIGPN